jgi:hypothetical protein
MGEISPSPVTPATFSTIFLARLYCSVFLWQRFTASLGRENFARENFGS